MRFLHFTLAIILAFGVLIGLSAFVQVNVSAKASDPIGLPSAFATPVVTLQSLIDAAPNGGTVNVAAGTYNESLTVNKTLTLTGVSSGTTIIQAVAGQHVITVTSGYNLRLENLTITGGHPSGAVGGGVFVMSGSLTLINVRIAGNSADYGGGVFQSGQGGRVDATNSRIELNTTTNHGGGLYVEKDGRDIPDVFLLTIDYPGEFSVFLVSTLTNDAQLGDRGVEECPVNQRRITKDMPCRSFGGRTHVFRIVSHQAIRIPPEPAVQETRQQTLAAQQQGPAARGRSSVGCSMDQSLAGSEPMGQTAGERSRRRGKPRQA